MSTPVISCPDCGAALTNSPACTSCDLPLVGPAAARLWRVDQRIASLTGEHAALLEERVRLLALLRSGEQLAPSLAQDTWGSVPARVPSAGRPPAAVPASQVVRKETTPRQVQNTLLTLGALLLALAGVVFAAVTYRHLGVVGRALVLLALTAVAGAAPMALVKRGLTSSAEAVGAVAVVLGVLDAWALRHAGFADEVDVRSYTAVATGVLALVAGLWTLAVPLYVGRLATVVLGQLPVWFVLLRTEPSRPVAAVVLTALAAVDLLVATEHRMPREVRLTAGALGGLTALFVLPLSAVAIAEDDRGAGAGLLALAALAVAAAALLRPERNLFAGIAVPLFAAAAWATIRPSLTDPQEPLVGVAVALLAVQVAALLPRALRPGPVGGALAVIGVALLTVAEPVLQAIAGPFTWLGDPWTLTATASRDALLPGEHWNGTVVTLAVLAAGAGCVLAAGLVLDRVRDALVPTAVLLALSALVLPLGLATSYEVALLLLLAAGIACCATGFYLPDFRLPLVAAGFATALLAAVWSVADREATLTVLPVVALLAAGLSLRLPVLAGAAALLGGAELAAGGAARDLAMDQVGGLLLIAPAVCVALTYLLRGTYRVSLESAAAVLGGTAVLLAVEDPGWLSWTLATTGLLCLAVAIRPDRREVGLVGALLLSASSWVRLANAGVEAPEPYVVPLALAALVFGFLRRRSSPEVSSFTAYGPGLTLALLPSLFKALSDETPTRALLLLAVCVGLVLLAAKDRLQAPLVIGGAVLVVDAVHLLSPYASALPRWSLLAVAGTLFVVVGATYEQRLREVNQLRARYDSWQ